IRLGQARLGRESCERAAGLAERAGRPDLFARAALVFGLELVGGHVSDRLVELLEAAHRLAPGGGALPAPGMGRLGSALMPSPAPERPLALAREAIALARTLGDPRVLAHVISTARGALTPAQSFAELRALDLELIDLAAGLGDRLLAIQAQGRLALL